MKANSPAPPNSNDDAPLVQRLATQQLAAYNQNDIDAFCACYHPEVVVLDANGQIRSQGLQVFRSRYKELFERFEVHATVSNRVCLPPHIVEHEHWQRTNRRTGEITQGAVLVRYLEKDGLLAVAQFWAAEP